MSTTNSNKYIQKLQSHALKFDFRTQCIVHAINTIKQNHWKEAHPHSKLLQIQLSTMNIINNIYPF